MVPISFASYTRCGLRKRVFPVAISTVAGAMITRMRSAPATTWLLVMMYPSGSTITPEPRERWRSRGCLLIPLILVVLGHAVAGNLNLHHGLHGSLGNLVDGLVIFLEDARRGRIGGRALRLTVEGWQ